MFSCFKSLNKKFICSICSACLLCMTGVSQLRADGEPLELGNTTVESAIANENMFLANTLQDHVYSSRLLPIFSQKPFLYVTDGKSILTLDETPSQDKIPFGTGTSTSVYIAAMPTDDISSDKSYYEDLTWYELDGSSWDKLCVRYPGTVKILYHVVSTDNNIKGTIDSAESLNLGYNGIKIDILYDDQFNPSTQMLGFSYIIVDKDGNPIQKIAKISMDPDEKGNANFTFGEFLENLLSMDFFLQTDVNQYDSDGNNLNENFEMNYATPYSLCMIMIKFAQHNSNDSMISSISAAMRNHSISKEYQYGDMEQGEGSKNWYDRFKFHENAKILGFTFKDSGEIIRISDNPNDKGNADCTLKDFLDNVMRPNLWNMNNVLDTIDGEPDYLKALQFDSEGKQISNATPVKVYSHPANICWAVEGLAAKNNNNEMEKAARLKVPDYTH